MPPIPPNPRLTAWQDAIRARVLEMCVASLKAENVRLYLGFPHDVDSAWTRVFRGGGE